MADEKIVGILVGRENTFPQAFIDRVNSKNMGVRAMFCSLGGTRMDEPIPFSTFGGATEERHGGVLPGHLIENRLHLTKTNDGRGRADLRGI